MKVSMILNCAIAFYLNLLFEDTRADNLLSSTESYQKEVATNGKSLQVYPAFVFSRTFLD